jgi:hypothetical protein
MLSTTAGSNNYTAAVPDMSTLSDGITWENAVKLCATLEEGGYTDWYLPNTMEIDALYNANLLGCSNINESAIINYWSNAELWGAFAWAKWFLEGVDVGDNQYVSKANTNDNGDVNIARCVRRY